eukprot:PhM_4_TR9124/c0_g1_i1/m.87079
MLKLVPATTATVTIICGHKRRHNVNEIALVVRDLGEVGHDHTHGVGLLRGANKELCLGLPLGDVRRKHAARGGVPAPLDPQAMPTESLRVQRIKGLRRVLKFYEMHVAGDTLGGGTTAAADSARDFDTENGSVLSKHSEDLVLVLERFAVHVLHAKRRRGSDISRCCRRGEAPGAALLLLPLATLSLPSPLPFFTLFTLLPLTLSLRRTLTFTLTLALFLLLLLFQGLLLPLAFPLLLFLLEPSLALRFLFLLAADHRLLLLLLMKAVVLRRLLVVVSMVAGPIFMRRWWLMVSVRLVVDTTGSVGWGARRRHCGGIVLLLWIVMWVVVVAISFTLLWLLRGVLMLLVVVLLLVLAIIIIIIIAPICTTSIRRVTVRHFFDNFLWSFFCNKVQKL